MSFLEKRHELVRESDFPKITLTCKLPSLARVAPTQHQVRLDIGLTSLVKIKRDSLPSVFLVLYTGALGWMQNILLFSTDKISTW